jgi:hypothetical protein
MPRGSKITNTDTPVDKKKYDQEFERIFGERKPSPRYDEGDDFIEGTADDKYRAGYNETFPKDVQ